MARIAKPEGMGEDTARQPGIKDISAEYAGLLEAAGVTSVADLARRNPQKLLQKLVDASAGRNLVPQAPTLLQVAGWIKQAQAQSYRPGATEKLTNAHQENELPTEDISVEIISIDPEDWPGDNEIIEIIIDNEDLPDEDKTTRESRREIDLDEAEEADGSLPGDGGTDNLP
jgi:hypothetical protein